MGDIPLEKLTSLELKKLCKKLLTKGRVDWLEAKGHSLRVSAPRQCGTSTKFYLLP
ncbi:hypothetical protein QUW63_13870 [Pseudoflavonifractor phocaeensis]|uniref:hypothetical protein n=1 Tax=Pseudoflavonifractor phocaeensis TaxID=1870988 RepID=UPI0025A331F2|nr:hypothetical protein [Pseudoflavonifractor phocaeensis]MDM8240178.1 hypothetical protein [Pseudoflavonifractor phocaeensis]